MRIGFAVKVIREPLKEADLRRAQNRPSLAQSLLYLETVFAYLIDNEIPMYRMSSDLAKYMTHPDYPEFHNQIPKNLAMLEGLGKLARANGIRLSFHPSQFIVLNTPDEGLLQRSMADLEWQAEILDAMELDDNAVVVLHLGGGYGDLPAAKERFVRNFERCAEPIRRRLVIENDDVTYSVNDCLWVRERTGLRVVFDNLHHAAVNPDGVPESEALRACLRTWPRGQTPKVHFASPATQFVQDGKSAKQTQRAPSRWTSHADFVDPFAFERFVAQPATRDFDVMLEAKAKDLAVVALRRFLLARGFVFDGGRIAKVPQKRHEVA